MKRLLMLLAVALIVAAMMAINGLGAGTAFAACPNSANCISQNPGGQPHGASQTTTFVPGHRGNG
jgi:hypothetical protein